MSKAPEDRRNIVLETNVSAVEKAQIVEAAKSQGLATGAFMRQAAMHFVKKLAKS